MQPLVDAPALEIRKIKSGGTMANLQSDTQLESTP